MLSMMVACSNVAALVAGWRDPGPPPYADAWYELDATPLALDHGALDVSFAYLRTYGDGSSGELYYAGEAPSSYPLDELDGGAWTYDGAVLHVDLSPSLVEALGSPRNDVDFRVDGRRVELVQCGCDVLTMHKYGGPWRSVVHSAPF